jgi:hypothetical protein
MTVMARSDASAITLWPQLDNRSKRTRCGGNAAHEVLVALYRDHRVVLTAENECRTLNAQAGSCPAAAGPSCLGEWRGRDASALPPRTREWLAHGQIIFLQMAPCSMFGRVGAFEARTDGDQAAKCIEQGGCDPLAMNATRTS